MIKVGEKVVIKGWAQFKPIVSRIYKVNSKGVETKWDFDTGTIMLELNWEEYKMQNSKVALHDENKVWFKYSTSN